MLVLDVSTGDFFVSDSKSSFEIFKSLITQYSPDEILFHTFNSHDEKKYTEFINQSGIFTNSINSWLYDKEYLENTIRETFNLTSLEGIDLTTESRILSAGSIIEYVSDRYKKFA
jgi:DNA mismatch repair protein MutS